MSPIESADESCAFT